MLISSGAFLLSKKYTFIPYTVLLVIFGLLLIPLSHTGLFSFIDDFKLTPEILFFVFLPVLIFESAYNMNYRQLLKNWKSISILSVVGLLISALLIAGWLFYIFPLFGLQIPFLVCLLFWSLISATDPVAVLSIFKSLWAPRRLTLIFEGESLFNDGTALALFLVILWIILEWTTGGAAVFSGIWSFSSMVFGWILFWAFFWVLFSKLIGYVKNDESVEITLTLVMAHLTFVLSELVSEFLVIGDFHVKISWVIATTIAGIIVWNYGRYKISPKVEEYMEKFWGFFAFISNSLVFILLGLILSWLDIHFGQFITPIIVVILVVMAARAISIYLPISCMNFFKMEEYIPMSWQHMLSWWSLRGALALMMVLLVPAPGDENYEKLLAFEKTVGWNFDFSIRDFILVITIGSIMFTLFIKATTITYFMRKMGIDKLHELEEFEYEEWKILSNIKIIEKLNMSFQKGYVTEDEYDELKKKYTTRLDKSVQMLSKLLNWQKDKAIALVRRAISLHALWIEKQYLKHLFEYNEINEKNFKHILNKIVRQIERIETGAPQLKSVSELPSDSDIFQKCLSKVSKTPSEYADVYMRNRARVIITRKVIKELEILRDIDFWFDKSAFDEVITLYKHFHTMAEDKRNEIYSTHKTSISSIESRLVDKSLLKLEWNIIEDLFEKEIITPKLYIKFMEEIEHEILKDVKTV